MIEREWTTAAGYPAMVTKAGDIRCGYIGIPAGNYYYGLFVSNPTASTTMPFTAHLGLTYAGNQNGGVEMNGNHSADAPTDPAYWWIGFDCADSPRPLQYLTAQCEALAQVTKNANMGKSASERQDFQAAIAAEWIKNQPPPGEPAP